VAAFLALYACEVVVEGSHAKRELHPTAIRMHYLLDIFVEIPLMIGLLVTGVMLTLLLEEITVLHALLIASGTIVVLSCFFCFFRFVRTRKRLLNEEPTDHDALARIRKRFGTFSFAVLNPALVVALIVGFWLAHQRALESFCR
jgi:ABC-type sulfate transport system permease component